MCRREWRLGTVALLAFLQGCSVLAPPADVSVPVGAALPAEGPVCRVGPDGGPPRVGERGIGGTGAPPALSAERGIGGTGIVGVITGFASLCVAGREVGYGPDLPVSEDGRVVAVGGLRAGQVVAVEADGALMARRVAIRHEVVGPVQGMELGLLRIGGQRVAVSALTLGVAAPGALGVSAPGALGVAAPDGGAWVAVSGFRDGDGVIHATRIDLVRPGGAGAEGLGSTGAVVRGMLVREGGTVRIGTLEVRAAPGVRLRDGAVVVVSGRWMDGVLLAEDVRAEDVRAGFGGDAFFGPLVGVVVIEGYAGVNEGRLVLTRAESGRSGGPARRSVVELERRADGTLRPALVRELGAGGRSGLGEAGAEHAGSRGAGLGGPRHGSQPAPMANRGIDGSRGASGAGRTGDGVGRAGGPARGLVGGDAGGGPGVAGGVAGARRR